MTARPVPAEELGLPRFALPADAPAADAFDLASHRRAREALAFGLALRAAGFNIFVVGEDRSGRMTATLDFLNASMVGRPVPGDWVYLNNFAQPHRPRPHRLAAGTARRFRDRLADLVPRLRDALLQALAADGFQTAIRERAAPLRAAAQSRIETLRAAARALGLDAVESERGVVLTAPPETAASRPDDQSAHRLAAEAEAINRWVAEQQAELERWRDALARRIAEQTTGTLLDEAIGAFQGDPGLARWLTEMRVDLVARVPLLLATPPEEMPAALEAMQRRYAINVLVDNADGDGPPVVVDPSPDVESVFGRIDYRQEQGGLTTDFLLVRAGSLHRANGGVLVLRAEAVAADDELWTALKAALRDGEIRIEERHRDGGPPIASAPQPGPVPLDAKIVLVGHPRWHHVFFAGDPDFAVHFKIRAEIDADLPATPDQVAIYAGLIRRMAARHGDAALGDDALARLLAIAARWADDRDRLSARFELIDDLIAEAACLVRGTGTAIDAAAIDRAVAQRRRRNARVEDKVHEAIARGHVLIDVAGAAVGQINALTVREIGDHAFGAPSRITARASMGRRGVINIERDVALGGPIQQKGAMVIQGWLMGRFARRMPLSFNCSVTFEQSYGGIEGDSASLAELLAILSDLADVPLRQDLAITGSINQRGQAQPIGGARQKTEGFFRACTDRGALTGTQGVVLPAANMRNLVLRDEVAQAVAQGRFQVWTVETIEDAIALFTGIEAGAADAAGAYPAGTLLGRVQATLEEFDRRLAARPG
jgi:predicted ATP-dependent protease